RASCGLQLSQSGTRKKREADPAPIPFTGQTGFSRCGDAAEQANSQENPPIAASGRSSLCKQRRSCRAHGEEQPARVLFATRAGGRERNRDEIRKTRMPHLGCRNSP